jgi:hypothetical protein
MPDLDFQNLSTVQSLLQPKPVTLASAATIAPTTFLTVVTGTVVIQTVTPPVTGTHMLCLVFTTTTPSTLSATGGNINNITTPTSNVPVFLIYNPLTAKYSGKS